MAKKETTQSDLIFNNKIILRSVYGKVGIKYFIQPCPNPKTGQMPSCIKKVDSHGDMIMSDEERNKLANGEIVLFKEDHTFIITDGMVFDLTDKIDKATWEAIKYCPLIAPELTAKNPDGTYMIHGTTDRKEVKHGRLLKAKLLGKHMTNMPSTDVEDYLLAVAEKDPDKIIKLYTGEDMDLRLLLVEARDKGVVIIKNKMYIYGARPIGATEEAAIEWMKQSSNQKFVEMMKQDTFPDLQ